MEHDPKNLILEAFELMGVSNPNIGDCKFLSKEMQFVLGESLSPITLYRMVNKEKQNVKPYAFSLELLRRFIDLKTLRPRDEMHFAPNYFSKSSVSENALYLLLEQQLVSSRIDDIGAFIEKLPMEHWSLGWEQYVIACALGETAKEKGIKSIVEPFLELPQIRTYLLETYVDFNQPFHFYLPLLKKIGAHQQLFNLKRIESQDLNSFGSSLFSMSLAYLLCFLGRKKDNVNWEEMIFHPSINEMLEERKTRIPIPASRLYVARILAFGKRNDTVQLNRTLEEFIDLQTRNSSISSREFSLAIVCDALLLLQKREKLTFLLEKFPNPNEKRIAFDPTSIRLELYRKVFIKNQAKVLLLAQDYRFQLGEQESDYHQLMIQLLLQNSKQKPQKSLTSSLIQRTGFRHFGKLVS